MYRTEKLRGSAYIRNRYVLRRADTLLWFWVVWTGAGRTTSRVGVIPSHEVRASFVHPRRRDNRCDGERHGYGIMLEVRERTGGRVRLGPGTLYGAIKRLKEGGVIEESGERPDPGEAPDDERRRYYRLTGFGGKVLAAEVERLDGLVRAARRKGAFPAPKPSPEGA